MYKGYLIDLDGTTYFGSQRIPTAEAFIKQLVAREIPFRFVTNNATKSPSEIAERLNGVYGLPVTEEHVYTSGVAVVDYLKRHHAGQSVYVVGEQSLHQQVAEAGFALNQTEQAEVVVQALNRNTDYEELATACLAIRNGAAFLVTNTDSNIPTEKGMLPSSGALTAFLEYSTQVKPIVMGKPYAPIMEGALTQLNLPKEDVLLIGDNYATDIKAGIDEGVDTLLVLTGFTQLEDLANVEEQPTYVCHDLSEWELDAK